VTSDKARRAIAQEAKDLNEAQEYLDKAAKAYKDAMEAKPGEKEFRSPDGRMEEAVRLYATISRHKAEYEEAVLKKKSERAASTTVAGVRGGGPPPGAIPASAFERVIGMCQDHIPEPAQLIRDHPGELHFERGLSLDEELKLRKECGSDAKGIVAEIRAQLSKTPAQPVPKPAAKSK
jgi:hypothetical protein